ncbi:MAG: hypothetical protein A7316_10590 [Candidatus Altiarchaeales archaeon WOR_SM1_86-2]|nr:MAG: hypothetical protein A7316_10590 [Candidatus Altiarchaeales archaeon WOR_SM1_86-2]
MNGWEWKKLGEICKVKKGNSITNAKVNPGSVPVIAGGRQPAYYHDQSNRNGNVITISASGAYAGFVNYFLEPIFASDCTTIQSLDEYKVLTRYVHLMLKCQQERIYGLQSGAGQPHVYPRDIIHIKIPLPPLPVQKQIVSILERAEKLKEKRKQANEETSKLLQSIFLEIFDENKYPFEEILNHIEKTNSRDPTKQPDDYFKYIDIAGIDNSIGYIKEIKEILGKDAPSRARREVKQNDIIVSTVRPNLNATALIPKELNNQICSTGFCVLRCKKTLNPRYLYTITRQKKFVEELVSKMKGASYPAVTNTDVMKVRIPIPPIELQNQFALIVERVESLKENQQKSTEDINQLFDALMQKAFNGEVTA